MLINLNYQSRTPIYEQIINEIERYAVLGVLKPNEQIPAIRELAVQLGVNPNTVKKAYEELERKKVIVTLSTKGSYIASNISGIIDEKVTAKVDEIKSIMKEGFVMKKMGLGTQMKIFKVLMKKKSCLYMVKNKLGD